MIDVQMADGYGEAGNRLPVHASRRAT